MASAAIRMTVLVWFLSALLIAPLRADEAVQQDSNHFRVIGPGQEAFVERLFAPYSLDGDLPGDYRFAKLSIEARRVTVVVERAGRQAELILEPASDQPAWKKSSQFNLSRSGSSDALDALTALAEAAIRNGVSPWDERGFDATVPMIFGETDFHTLDLRRTLKFGERTANGIGAMYLGLLVFVLIGSLLYCKRNGRSGWVNGLLVAVSVLIVLWIAETVLVVSGESWRLPVHVMDDCYPTNPRGYFKEAFFDPSREMVMYCAGGQDEIMRSCERETAKQAPHDWRILALGDSFTAGIGVKAQDTWPNRLTGMLNQMPERKQAARAVNCGIPAANLDTVIKRYRKYGERHRSQVVVYAIVLNDFLAAAGSRFFTASQISFQWQSGFGYVEHVFQHPSFGFLVRNLALVHFAVERLQRKRLASATERFYRDLYADPPSKKLSELLDRTAGLAATVEGDGAHFMAAIFPLFYELDDYPLRAAHVLLKRELTARGIEVLDLLDTYAGMEAAELQVHPTDYHPNDVAQLLAAQAIAERLTKLGWADGEAHK